MLETSFTVCEEAKEQEEWESIILHLGEGVLIVTGRGMGRHPLPARCSQELIWSAMAAPCWKRFDALKTL